MSREIKFRAWDKENKKMYYSEETNWDVDFRFDEKGCLKCYINCSYADSFGEEHNNWTELNNIMEYTGLKDIYKKEICEGDIVKYRLDGHGYKFVNLQVEYLIEEAGFYLTQNSGDRKIAVISMLNAHISCEVIGNICENKHLMEVE